MKNLILVVLVFTTSLVFSQGNSDLLLESACRKVIIHRQQNLKDSGVPNTIYYNPLSDSVSFAKYKDMLRKEVLIVYKEYRRKLGLNTNITLSDNLNKACSLNSVKIQKYFKKNNIRCFSELKRYDREYHNEILYLSHSELQERLNISGHTSYRSIGENVTWYYLKNLKIKDFSSPQSDISEIKNFITENNTRKIAEFLIDGWDKSPVHHENLILPNMKSVGFDLDYILDKRLETNSSYTQIVATMLYETK